MFFPDWADDARKNNTREDRNCELPHQKRILSAKLIFREACEPFR